MGGQFFTWEALSALGGASLLTYFVVQYTKKLVDRFAQWLPTDIYAVLVAFVILVTAQFATGAHENWKVYGLAFANSFLVAVAAGQIHDKAITPPGEKAQKKEADSDGKAS